MNIKRCIEVDHESRTTNYCLLKVVKSQHRHFELLQEEGTNQSDKMHLFWWSFILDQLLLFNLVFDLFALYWITVYHYIVLKEIQQLNWGVEEVKVYPMQVNPHLSVRLMHVFSPRIWDRFLLLPSIQRKYVQWLKELIFSQKNMASIIRIRIIRSCYWVLIT